MRIIAMLSSKIVLRQGEKKKMLYKNLFLTREQSQPGVYLRFGQSREGISKPRQ